jgi:hypothetical protein
MRRKKQMKNIDVEVILRIRAELNTESDSDTDIITTALNNLINRKGTYRFINWSGGPNKGRNWGGERFLADLTKVRPDIEDKEGRYPPLVSLNLAQAIAYVDLRKKLKAGIELTHTEQLVFNVLLEQIDRYFESKVERKTKKDK